MSIKHKVHLNINDINTEVLRKQLQMTKAKVLQAQLVHKQERDRQNVKEKKELTIMTGVLKQKVLIDNQSGLLMAMMVVTKMMIARPLMSLQNDDDVIE